MLRRRKEDVTKDIPPKEETIIDVELTMVQKKYYRAIYERNHSVLNKVCSVLFLFDMLRVSTNLYMAGDPVCR